MSSPPSQEDLEYWKAKYLKLLSADDQHRVEWEQEEELLTKAVVRLTLLAEGLDKALDPHLKAIREMVRGNKKGPKLHQKLDELLETLIRTPDADKPLEFAPVGLTVVRFLETLKLDRIQQTQLKNLRRQIESGACKTENELFAAAAPLLNACESMSDAPAAGGLLTKLLGKNNRGVSPLEPKHLRTHLADLLAAMKVPLSLDKRRCDLLKAARETESDILELIDGAAALVAELGQETDKEHSQLKDFLTTLSGKLVDLEEKTLGMGSMAETSARSRIESDQAVSGQVEDMRAVAQAATDLSQLQAVMASRLEGISKHLEENRNAEENRFAQTQQQVRDLAERLLILEQESIELRNQLSMANDLAFTDVLTRLPNRAAYQERVALEELRWKRFQYPISLLIWDIDFFKDINDRFGHPAGDKALQVIAEVLRHDIRGTDFLARIGGEEFVMLLPGTDTGSALEVANQIRRRVENCGFNSDGKPITITVSCGISSFHPPGGHEPAYARADQALYQAKRDGRNRCLVME